MKTTKMIALALLAFCAGVKAQTVTVADVEALPGETVAFTLDLTGGKADTYTAMQFDAQFPVTGFSTTGLYTVSDLWMNATATVGSVNVDGVATIPVASSESISASDVEGLFSVFFTVDGSVEVGDYEVTLKNLWFGYGTSSKDYLADVTFKVHVVNAHNVVLDENSTTAPESAEDVNVTVKRTISAGSWSTICLPFAMTEAQCKAAFGDDVELADFTHCEATYDGDDVTGLNVEFQDVDIAGGMEANHPYIIKVSEAITEFTADGVDIEAEEEPSVDRDEYRTGSGTKKDPYVYHYNSLVGVYEAQTDVPELCLFLSGNQFWYSTGATQMKAFRAYFDFYDVLSNVEESGARIALSIDDDPTGIVSVRRSEKQDNVYYDLTGRRTDRPRRGIYIVNGKKVLVK